MVVIGALVGASIAKGGSEALQANSESTDLCLIYCEYLFHLKRDAQFFANLPGECCLSRLS